MNPTHAVLEERVAQLEGGAGALALSSGTSAVFYSIINICQAGDEFVSANNLNMEEVTHSLITYFHNSG